MIVVAALLGGCSADVTRFDFASSENGATGSVTLPPEPVARNYPRFDDPPSAPPRGAGLASEARGSYDNAPPVASQREATPGERPYSDPPPRVSDPPPRVAMAPANDRFTARHIDRLQPQVYQPGETVEVQPGDSIYGLAKRYSVSIAALIELNGLKNGSSLQPGQRIILPAGARIPRDGALARVSAQPAVSPPPPAQRPAPPTASAPPSGWQGQHTMKAGESLYGIARQHGVSLADLQRVNGITEPTRVRIGTVLRIPGNAQAAAQSAPAAPPAGPPSKARLINTPVEETQPPAERKVAALGDRVTDASPAVAEPAAARFRWPVRGRIISGFGRRPDGTHNDGINLAVPQGTDIHAVEGGKVAYAGNELKGYGNLVLIRHERGWVSAYAHADQIMVKRDDVVRRGQVIAKAGRTGTVDQPQLHFELRQGAKPIDPLPHLEN